MGLRVHQGLFLSKMHAWLCKSIQWLLLPLILHEHVTLFWRPLCFHSMPLHLFIFLFPLFLVALIILLTWPGIRSIVVDGWNFLLMTPLVLWVSWNYILLIVPKVLKCMLLYSIFLIILDLCIFYTNEVYRKLKLKDSTHTFYCKACCLWVSIFYF